MSVPSALAPCVFSNLPPSLCVGSSLIFWVVKNVVTGELRRPHKTALRNIISPPAKVSGWVGCGHFVGWGEHCFNWQITFIQFGLCGLGPNWSSMVELLTALH